MGQWMTWTTLLSLAALGLRAEKTKLGAAFSAPIVTMASALVLSNIGMLPITSPAYSAVNGFLLPLAVPLLLFDADLRKIRKEAAALLPAFALGTLGTVLGTLVAARFIPLTSLGMDAPIIMAALAARHVGGAVNYVAVTETLGASSTAAAAGIAADNLVIALYFIFLFTIVPSAPVSQEAVPTESNIPPADKGTISLDTITTALAMGAAICGGGTFLAAICPFPMSPIPAATFLAVVFASMAPNTAAHLAPTGSVLGAVCMQLFFACTGAAGGKVVTVFRNCSSLFLFSALQLGVHAAITLGLGSRLGKIPLRRLALASNANVGGPTTAAGMASAKGWLELKAPAILVGVAGYAGGTLLGLALLPFLGGVRLRTFL